MDVGKYFDRITDYIENINIVELVNASKVMMESTYFGKTIYIAGNGGSMSTSMHFAEDLMLQNNLKIKVVPLCSSPCLTAIGNDYNFESIFKKQLKSVMERGDVLIVISASGDSENLVQAVDFANTMGHTIGIVGFDGGRLKNKCENVIHVKTKDKDYEATEDIHSIICHILECMLKEEKK